VAIRPARTRTKAADVMHEGFNARNKCAAVRLVLSANSFSLARLTARAPSASEAARRSRPAARRRPARPRWPWPPGAPLTLLPRSWLLLPWALPLQ
jgi:hypothetical protein